MKEKEGYRDTIEDLQRRGYPAVLTRTHIKEIMGYKSDSAVTHRFQMKNGRITIADFARQICL